MKNKYNWRITVAAIIITVAGPITGCSKEDPKPCVRYVQRVRPADQVQAVPLVVLNPRR